MREQSDEQSQLSPDIRHAARVCACNAAGRKIREAEPTRAASEKIGEKNAPLPDNNDTLVKCREFGVEELKPNQEDRHSSRRSSPSDQRDAGSAVDWLQPNLPPTVSSNEMQSGHDSAFSRL
ncbi:sulfate transporter [Pseudozyma hubeiensis SY62]|uniref:Sulfate transporter n=1 Tax=Pseudozyma hubeiensis (strain SY62) TaxID=1305764 RepID=R9P9Y4_PSEHS|nr:sulfate transporter [Pseudozyma hubeiensis SY62]GAC98067.1 sulfate transporter [Pseudozyma hubeiensis SY62]